MVAILVALTRNDHFDEVLLDLQVMADSPVEPGSVAGETKLPQVHALNCLKDIFTDARLGPRTEIHMTRSLGISISCLESET